MSSTDIDTHVAALWREAGHVLGFSIVSPFAALGPRGESAGALVWLRDFGTPRGALVCTSTDPHGLATLAIEWGYEVVDHNPYAYPAQCDQNLFISILARLGWAGPPADRPTWMPRPSGPTWTPRTSGPTWTPESSR